MDDFAGQEVQENLVDSDGSARGDTASDTSPSNTTNADAAHAGTEQASEVFVGRWRRLVSTTNWEKGRIIAQWRDALIESGAAATEYSDEAWANRVGGVTSQHVGRLRRVFQRFGVTFEKFGGLYWSHFHSAVEWNDAEMWLEGAVQNDWSVSEMRRMRWETLGAVEELRPRSEEIVASDLDEDVAAETAESQTAYETDLSAPFDTADASDAAETGEARAEMLSEPADDAEASEAAALVRPFADLSSLPSDLADAFESFKLAILRHKAEAWSRVSATDVMASLDALKALVLAPSEA